MQQPSEERSQGVSGDPLFLSLSLPTHESNMKSPPIAWPCTPQNLQ